MDQGGNEPAAAKVPASGLPALTCMIERETERDRQRVRSAATARCQLRSIFFFLLILFFFCLSPLSFSACLGVFFGSH